MKPTATANSDMATYNEMAIELSQSFLDLVEVVARLRAPDGCPWDRQQTHASVARNITEEAAEVVDAIERENLSDLREELGDLLLQVLLQSQMASEADEFTLAQVIDGITRKLVRRHPHVFGTTAALDAAQLSEAARKHLEEQIQAAANPEAVLKLWDNIKLIERQQKNQDQKAPSTLDSVPNALPALMQAQDISRKAISVGFDWAGVEEVWQQLASEISEFKAEPSGSPTAADEFGDMLFSLVNIGLKEGIDAESALRSTIRRFRERWAIMEGYALQAGRELSDFSTVEQEAFWQQAKRQLAQPSTSDQENTPVDKTTVQSTDFKV